jgi:hypothetical protein
MTEVSADADMTKSNVLRVTPYVVPEGVKLGPPQDAGHPSDLKPERSARQDQNRDHDFGATRRD